MKFPVELSKGSVGFHHCLTYHRSEPNRSQHSRRAYTVIFMTGDARWTGTGDYRFPFLHVQGKALAGLRGHEARASGKIGIASLGRFGQ